MEIIYRRRSIRKFAATPVPADAIEAVIKAGMNAPSAGDEQPWQFLVLEDRATFRDIMRLHPHAGMLDTAPTAVLVCGDLSLETHKGYWVQDCSAATQNMLLEVVDKGLGSVWVGIYPRTERVEGIRKLLRLPDHIVPFALLPIGYPAEHKPAKNIFHRDRIHRDRW